MRYILLLALVLPYAFATPFQDQESTHQDINNEDWRPEENRVRRPTVEAGAGAASYRVTRRKEGRSSLDTFPQLQHTDCHSSVAARMNDRCGLSGAKENGVVMSEGERSDVAISLTICSMSSALQPIPTECHLWTTAADGVKAKEGRRWLWGGSERGGDVRASRSMCLSALHRSPQDWTAYNNYLSDALQLCHALRSQHAEETARDLYRNATQSQIDLLSLLSTTAENREARDSQQSELTYSQLLKSEQAASHVSHLVDQLHQGSQDANAAVDEVRSAISGFASGADIWRDVQEDSMRRSEALFDRMTAGLDDIKGVFARELATELRNIAANHGENMQTQNDRLGEEMGISIKSAQGGIELLMMQVADRLRDNDLALQQWGDTMYLAQRNLAGLASDAQDLRPVIRDSVDSALAIQSAHLGLAQFMRETDSISESITRNLAIALLEINSTMAEVRLGKVRAASTWQWFQPGFSLFSSPALLTSPTLSGLMSPTTLQAMAYTANFSLGWIARILLWIISQLASSIVSIGAVLVIAASGILAGQIMRLRSTFKRLIDNDEDTESAHSTVELPRTPRQRLESLAPPAYASPQRALRSHNANLLALSFDVDANALEGGARDYGEHVGEAMLRRSYGNLRQGGGRARRSVSAPL